MANPAIVNCPKDQWTLVATGVNRGFVWTKRIAVQYLHTYKMTGEAAPLDSDLSTSVPIRDLVTPILYSDDVGGSIDVYVMAIGQDGIVRVDL